MAATVKVRLSVEIEGLDSDDQANLSRAFTHDVTPEEYFKGRDIIGSTAANLDLGAIDDTDLTGVLIIARGTADTDYVGILVDDDGTGTPSTVAGNLTLNAGEAVYLNFGGSTGGLTNGKYIRVKGSAATTAITYFVFGKHT